MIPVGLVAAVLTATVAVMVPAGLAGADGNEAPGAPLAARSITAGGVHNCALLSNGTVKCWGRGTFGNLGQDSTDDLGDEPGEMAALAPVNLGPGRTATAITAGYLHACALLDDATVKCWGDGDDGQLGQDSTDTLGDEPGEMAAIPPINLGAGRTATAISAGLQHTCALLDDATVKCWGGNDRGGQLGQDSTDTLGDEPGEMAAIPPINLGAGRTATAISAGNFHTCALLDDGTVKCWGFNILGQLGQDSTDDLGDEPGEMAAIPPINLGAGRTATAISAGNVHTCAVLDDATVKCWGSSQPGKLGQDSNDTLGDEPGEMAAIPPINLGAGRTATAISAGNFQSCALLDNATVKCWGNGIFGVLGQDSTDALGDEPGEMAAIPPINLGAGRTATAITTGNVHTCAVLDDGTVKCWGYGNRGLLGQDSEDTLGDEPGEMAALPPIVLGGLVGVPPTPTDTTDPTATITTPVQAAEYTQNAVIEAGYTCADEEEGSGIDTCDGPVADGAPIDTSTLGHHPFTVVATDNAANTGEATTTYTVIAPDNTFTDVPPWLTKAVNWIANPNNSPVHATGYGDGFRPDQAITRAQLAVWLHNIAGAPDMSGKPHGLTDVTAWAENAVRFVVDAGIATGYSDDTFRGAKPITRASGTIWLHRALGTPTGAQPHTFTDVPAWIDTAVSWITDPTANPPIAIGYPDNTYRPTNDYTRGQAARAIYHVYLNLIGPIPD